MAYRLAIIAFCAMLLLAVGCKEAPSAVEDGTPAGTNTEQPSSPGSNSTPSLGQLPATDTPIPPSPTPDEPLAATVNGKPVYLAAFEEALARQQQGQSLVMPGTTPDGNEEVLVLNMLIERSLIEQAATTHGIAITPEMVDEQIAELKQVAEEAGGAGSFEAWLQANQWTEESFRDALAYEMLAERVSTMVTAEVPETVSQVRARYIQVEDRAQAQSLLEQIQDGADFAALAQEYSLDRTTAADGGDLGYFARGTLLVPELEEAAFALQPGEVSEVITASSPNGGQTVYYIVEVMDVDPGRPLGPDQRAALLQEHFEAWLAEQWSQAEIVRYIETGA